MGPLGDQDEVRDKSVINRARVQHGVNGEGR